MDVSAIATLYDKVADLLEKNGMVAGVRQERVEGVPKHCVLGGFDVITNSYGGYFKDLQPLIQILGLTPQEDLYNSPQNKDKPDYIVAAWSNNAVDAGHPEIVINGLRKAASELRNGNYNA